MIALALSTPLLHYQLNCRPCRNSIPAGKRQCIPHHQVFSQLLADFAQHFEIGADKRVVLAVDQACFHTSPQVQVPEGIELVFMPPKSPELQPAERLWPLTNEAIANRTFDNLDSLEEVTVQRCRTLLKQPELIRGLTDFHWWPRGAV